MISVLQSIGLEIEMLKYVLMKQEKYKKDEVKVKSIIISFYSYRKKKVHKKLNGLSQDKTILYVNSKWWQWLGAKYCLVLSRRVIQYFCHQSQNFNWKSFWIAYTIAFKYILTYDLFVTIYIKNKIIRCRQFETKLSEWCHIWTLFTIGYLFIKQLFNVIKW